MNKKKELKKKVFRTLDRYGVFNERPFIKRQYREELFEDILKLVEKYGQQYATA